MVKDTISKTEAKINEHIADCLQLRKSTERRLGKIETRQWQAMVGGFSLSLTIIFLLVGILFQGG